MMRRREHKRASYRGDLARATRNSPDVRQAAV